METKKISEEQIKKLKEPLPKEAVSQHPTKTYLSSIKAIFVTERLSDVFGVGSWRINSEIIEKTTNGMVVVKVKLTIPEYNIELESFGGNDNGGEGNKNFDLGDAYKGAVTDAITKIGSWLYIGIDVFKGQKKPDQNNTQKQDEQNQKPWLNPKTKEWYAAIKFLSEGGLIPKIEEKYKISKENKEKLIKESL